MNGEMESVSYTKKKRNLFWLWIVLTAMVAGGGVAAFAYRGQISKWIGGEKPTQTATVENTTTTEPVKTGSTTTTSMSVKIVDEGITWLSPRQKLGDLKLFTKAGTNEDYSGTNYYKVATTSYGGEIILALAQTEGLMSYYDFHHFLKKDGVYYWLSNNSDKVGGEGGSYARTNSQVNSTLKILSILPEKTISSGSTVLTQDKTSSRRVDFADSEISGTKVTETKWGDLYLLKGEYVSKTNTSVKSSNYYLLRNDGMKIIYTIGTNFRLDDGTLNVTWSNQNGKDQKFSQVITSGCGNMGGTFPLIVDQTFLSDKTEVAKTTNGSKIYTVSANNTLAQLGYDVYNMDNLGDKVGKDEFVANLGVLVWQDAYDNWILFMNNKYTPAIECGKPVIYLYPEKDTQVSVKVGADVTKSEPFYDNGWNVLAKTSGELILDGKSYPNLYWEGTGFGPYPAIKTGTVVEKYQVKSTIESQLSYIGLNKIEIADFLEYWLPKMPNTKYVRLSWLTTEEMNRLAPLRVNPAPETTIRVFLDFSGSNERINVLPQILPKYERKGYTLVEWGGLLVK